MRSLTRLFLLSLFLLAAGCTAPKAAPDSAPTLDAAPRPYQPGSPVETTADAQGRIGVGEGQYDCWPPETRVWLVVFKGRWLLTPLDPNQASPTPVEYEGCGFTLFTGKNAEWMAMGDAVCPAN